jgi:hypothetical protein
VYGFESEATAIKEEQGQGAEDIRIFNGPTPILVPKNDFLI